MNISCEQQNLPSCYRATTVLLRQVVSLSQSVALRYRDHIGWNSSKMISRLELVVFALHRP